MLAATGCLRQVTPLIGISAVGGSPDAGDDGDAGDGGDAGDAGTKISDGGDGGAMASDGGDAGNVACPWRDAGDAGSCTDDSQCPTGFYCDFTVTVCPDGFSTVNPGVCLLACSVTAAIAGSPGASCEVNEDCSPGEFCSCTSPCGDTRHCYRTGGDAICSAPFPLPPGCTSITVPHSPVEACVCSGNTCFPDGGDGGMAQNDGGLCGDTTCAPEMSCTTSAPFQCCIDITSYLNRCQDDSDCCPIVVNGASQPVRCKDTVCQNDRQLACNRDSDCSPGNVCIGNVCLIVAGAVACNNDQDCESNDCLGPSCSCYPDNQSNGVINNASCCSGNDSSGTCMANTQGQSCITNGCGPGEFCGDGGICCILSTSREQATLASNCCDGTFDPDSGECCSASPQTACVSNNDCCQGLICDTDLASPVCLFVANNPGCRPGHDPSDCLPGLTCDATTRCE
jgi:hypothetical protein